MAAAAAVSLLSYLSFLSWHLLLLPISSLAQNSSNIILGSYLSTLQENYSWPSPSGDFAFGFYRLSGKDEFLLAVWFNKIPQRTVVWSTKGDNPVPRGSKLELTNDGMLKLYDNQGQESWTPNLTTAAFTTAVAAAMLDTGEFLLKGPNSSRIWSTFDRPTDTILPTQKLEQNSFLSSRSAEDHYSSGKFQLRLQTDGNLKLYTVNVPTGYTYNNPISISNNSVTMFIYNIYNGSLYNGDTVGSRSLGSGSELVFDEKGYVGLLQKNGTMNNLTSERPYPTSEFYHRASVDVDGVFRHYVYPKTGGSAWKVAGAFPSDLCTAVVSYPGSGVCGFNSYCKLDEKREPTCKCPTGYSYSNPNSPLEGCKPNFTVPSCYSDGIGEKKVMYEMKEIPNTTWLVADFEEYSPVQEGFCGNSCLNDCLCAVAVFDNGFCLKKKLPLSNGRAGAWITAKTLVKVPKLNSSLRDPHPPDSCNGKKFLVVSSLMGSSFFLNFLFVTAISPAFFYFYHKKLLGFHKDSSSSLFGLNLRSFTFKQLEEATNGFKEEIGRGAFGTVYKGILASDSSNVVAVKRLHKVVQEGEREFKTEVSVIGQTHHRNLVRLLGFCDEGLHRLLVYEFMSNGSLASFLFGNPRPKWSQRCQIAIGIARGLMYLHDECSTQIIHCDIKPHNILLDDGFIARIADFGMAKLLKTDQSRTSTEIRGTRGYLAPEWFKNMSITVKVDVYSFGIMLLEIISCRNHLQLESGNEDEVFLKDWAYKCYREGRLELLVREDEEALEDRKMLEKMVMVAIWCVQDDPSLRPSMKRVVRMMTGVVEVSVPMDPCFSFHKDESWNPGDGSPLYQESM